VPSAALTVPRGVIRRGLGVLWQAVKEEPRIFAISTVGSGLFALTTIGQAYVFGAITSRSSSRASGTGSRAPPRWPSPSSRSCSWRPSRSVGIIARRLGAGIMQYRLQAAYRRRVTRRYLELPLAWHQDHSDRRAAVQRQQRRRGDLVPDRAVPLRGRRHLMLVTTLGLLFVTDPVLALVGSSSSPRSRC
jgi:hypothetical protein